MQLHFYEAVAAEFNEYGEFALSKNSKSHERKFKKKCLANALFLVLFGTTAPKKGNSSCKVALGRNDR